MTPIVLDTTLADLYRQNGVHDDLVITLHCVFMHMDLHPRWQCETRYPEDEEPASYTASEAERNQLRKLILGHKVVKRAFVAGNMKVLLFKPFASEENVGRAYKMLAKHQQPQPLFINLDADNDPYQTLLKETEFHKLLFWKPQGWMDKHDCLISPAMAYEINSKRYLVTSGIRTPRSDLLNMAEDDAKGVLSERALPFVVKLPWAVGGCGTFIVTSEDRRKTMLQSISEYLAKGRTEVLVSDYVDAAMGLSPHLFVGPLSSPTNKYKPAFLGTTFQQLKEDVVWLGATIDYSRQKEYTRLLEDIVRDTTSRLPDSFVGWIGLDILIDKDGSQWVVDLNARFTGSMPLPLLSAHFSKLREMNHGELATFTYKGGVQLAYDVLASELDDGNIIVLSVASVTEDLTTIDLAWGGRDLIDLQKRKAYIQEQLKSM